MAFYEQIYINIYVDHGHSLCNIPGVCKTNSQWAVGDWSVWLPRMMMQTMAMLPTSTLSIPFTQLLIFLQLLLLAWSRLGSVLWEIQDLISTVPTPTQWLMKSLVNPFLIYLTGYVTQSCMMQTLPHGLSAWNVLIHASPLSYFPMIKPSYWFQHRDCMSACQGEGWSLSLNPLPG